MLPALPAMVDLQPQPGGDLALSWADAPRVRDRTIPSAEITRLQHLVDASATKTPSRHDVTAGDATTVSFADGA